MHIVSNFKDYYDSVAYQYGVDKNIVYLREIKEFFLVEKRKKPSCDKNDRASMIRYLLNRLGYQSSGEVLFCGKRYPFLRNNNKCCYFYEEFLELVQRTDKKQYKDIQSSPDKKEEVIRCFKYFGEDVDNDIFFDYKSPIIIKDYDTGSIIVNPYLMPYDFIKVKDPDTAYREIYMFVSGILGSLGNKNINQEIPDKYKIAKHGFDQNMGFRKRQS
jgi:hypothetical protein